MIPEQAGQDDRQEEEEVKLRQVFGTLACGAVLLVAAGACGGDETPTANQPSVAAPSGAGQGDPESLLKRGIEQGQAGKSDEAKATFEKVLALQRDNKFAWFNLGYLAQARKATAEAIAAYDKVLEIDSSYRPAMYNKALLLEGTRPDEAITLYRKIVAADKSAYTSYLRLGLMLDKRDDRAGARQAFQLAVAANASMASVIPAEYRPQKPAK